eukprot:s571_g34.t2
MPDNNSDWIEVGDPTGKVSVPPLSALLDVRVPVVELEAAVLEEADRLHSAMSWLYTAVQKLQQQQVTTTGDVQHLQEQLRAKPPTPVSAPANVPEDVQMMLRQQEQRRLGDVSQMEMRLHGLRASIDGCLKSSDLEALRERLTRELDEMARRCKEELASLAKWLQTDAAAERQKQQENFQKLRFKVESHLSLVESGRKEATAEPRPASSQADLAHAGYQEPTVPVEMRSNEPRQPSADDLALRSRVAQLEASVKELDKLCMVLAPPPKAEGPSEIDPRILQRFTDVDKAHLSNIQRFSEIEQRLTRLETSVPAAMPKAKAGGDWQGPLSELQSSHASLAEELQASAGEVSTLRSALTELTRYISEDHLEVSATAAPPPNKLEWLERRISQLVAKRKGPSIEKRLQLLEEVTGSQEIFQRVRSLEQLLEKLDFDAVKEVPPQLIIVKEDQETFKQDLRREVQELKVLVGCMEACVPKETRKAIQLFKRGAGVSDEEFISPQELKTHTQLISMREELQGQFSEMQMNAAQRYDNMNAQLQELEMKQDRVEHLMKGKSKSVVEAPNPSDGFVAPEGWQR